MGMLSLFQLSVSMKSEENVKEMSVLHAEVLKAFTLDDNRNGRTQEASSDKESKVTSLW